jgi:hypothetical protein
MNVQERAFMRRLPWFVPAVQLNRHSATVKRDVEMMWRMQKAGLVRVKLDAATQVATATGTPAGYAALHAA